MDLNKDAAGFIRYIKKNLLHWKHCEQSRPRYKKQKYMQLVRSGLYLCLTLSNTLPARLSSVLRTGGVALEGVKTAPDDVSH